MTLAQAALQVVPDRAEATIAALEDGPLLRRWHAELRARHFSSRRIERELKAVVAYERELGSWRQWTEKGLEAPFRREQTANPVAARLALRAARRFLAFARCPDEIRLETEVLRGIWDEHLSSGHKLDTCERTRDAVLAFTDIKGRLWRCSKASMSGYSARAAESGRKRSTLRFNQIAVKKAIEFILDPGDDWSDRIFAQTGCRTRQICTRSNTVPHLFNCDEGDVGCPPTDDELITLFAFLRARVERAKASGRKGYWTAWRDHALFGFQFGSGGRDSCIAGTELTDLTPAFSEISTFSPYEDVHFRGKSAPGGGPKPRTVPAIELYRDQWAELGQYIRFVRPHLVRPHSGSALFLSERGNRLTPNEISSIFGELREEAGLPKDLHAHCLRHAFAVRLYQVGVDLSIIRMLLGHTCDSTTMRYVKQTPSFITHRLLECGRRQRRESRAYA